MYLCSRKNNNYMNTQLSIKNFRVFDENGVKIDIKPLTILTGCNSSGKSSIVKAAFLLNSFMKQIGEAIEKGEEIRLNNYKLDFTSYPNNLLGRFDKVIPKGSSATNCTIGYTVHSCMLSKDVEVQLVFAADMSDELNNAYLDSITMSIDEGVFYSSDKKNGSNCNLNIIKEYFIDYVKIEYLIDNYCGLICAYDGIGRGAISEEEFDKQNSKTIEILRGFGKKRVLDVVNYIRTKKGSFKCIGSKDKLELLEWTEGSGSYFNIPVVEYLKTINKNDLESIVETELLHNTSENALDAPVVAIDFITYKVISDFIQSDFDSFDCYFRDYEQRYFESISNREDVDRPCMLNVDLKQAYLLSYPVCSGMHIFGDESKEEQQSIEEKKKHQMQKIKEWESRPITFDILYAIVMLWNEKYTSDYSISNKYYREGQEVHDGSNVFSFPDGYHHYVFEMLTSFAKQLAEEVICQTGFENMSYVSSSRATVKKLYALDEKDDFTQLLQRYFEKKRLFLEKSTIKYSRNPDYEANSFLNKWIQLFGLGDSLSFNLDEDGLGVKMRLHKTEGDSGRLLSDEGYGITQLVSVLLQIETAILSAKGAKVNNYYGLSVFDRYDTDVFHFEENTIAIEEPEIHLHPSYQSRLAEMFAEAYRKYNIHFIIETHSEYLIRKLQVMVADKKSEISSHEVSLNYVENNAETTAVNRKILIQKDGRLSEPFGKGFFDEADSLAMDILKYTARRK